MDARARAVRMVAILSLDPIQAQLQGKYRFSFFARREVGRSGVGTVPRGALFQFAILD